MPSHTVSPRSVTAFRSVAVIALVFAVAFRARLSVAVGDAWAAMRGHWFVRHDSCEPLVAAAAFAVWVNLFRVCDRFVPALRRWRLVQRRVAPDTFTQIGHGSAAFAAYLLPLLAFDAFVQRRRLPVEPPSFEGLVAQVVASVFLYDFAFFWVHLALHTWRPLARFHERHHTKSPMNASEVVRHSLVDGGLQVGCNILVLNGLRSHPMARMLHNVVITYMLTELHSGCVVTQGRCTRSGHDVLPCCMCAAARTRRGAQV